MKKHAKKTNKKTYMKVTAVLVSLLLVIATVVPYGAAFAETPTVESAMAEVPEIAESADPAAVDLQEDLTADSDVSGKEIESEPDPADSPDDSVLEDAEAEPDAAEPDDAAVTEAVPDEDVAVDAGIADDESDPAADEPEDAEEADGEVSMPAQSFSKVSSSGVTVNVKADSGVLPEGTKLIVRDVPKKEAMEIAEEGIDDDTEIKSAIAVDITFEDADGNEIEPADGKSVIVSIKPKEMPEGDIEVLHQKDDGSIENVESEATSKQIKFDGSEFSVYVVVETEVPRLTVTFKNGTTELATMYVKAADSEAEVAKIIYDPGAGTVPAGQVFKGWTTDPNYSVSSTLYTIADIRSDAMTTVAGLTADDSVTYYPAIFKQFNVTYVDGEGIAVGSEVAETPSRLTEAAYTVNQGYTTDSTHNFEGWIPTDGLSNIVGYPNNAHSATIGGETVYYYENGQVITITGDVEFSVDAPEGYWLVFDENGKGATYNAPRRAP